MQLVKREVISHVITSDCHGLLTMSGQYLGISADKITELNGNTNTEFCNVCGKVYYRDFNVRNMANDLGVLNTERHCDKGRVKCQYGMLKSCYCNFAEDCSVIEGEPLEIIKDCDLVISLGFAYERFECLKKENLQAKFVVVNDREDKNAD